MHWFNPRARMLVYVRPIRDTQIHHDLLDLRYGQISVIPPTPYRPTPLKAGSFAGTLVLMFLIFVHVLAKHPVCYEVSLPGAFSKRIKRPAVNQ